MELKLSQYLSHNLPNLQICNTVALQEGDIVIHAPGFEDRTMDVLNSISPCIESRAILIDYLPYFSDNKLLEIQTGINRLGIKNSNIDTIKYDRFLPGDFEERLERLLLNKTVSRALIDISTMSKLLILLVLNVCHRIDINISIIYCEAKDYGPTQEEFNLARDNSEIHRPTIQIYDGIIGVVRADSLASVSMQGQPTAAIVFMSFNDALTQVLLNTIYPSRLFMVNGRPPVHSWREEATAWIHDQVRREWEEDNPISFSSKQQTYLPDRVTSTLYYQDTIALLLDIYWRMSTSYRILLAPSGSKLQTVGCYIAKALHHDIHIEYPSPESFFPKYSSGIGKRWFVDFGNMTKLLKDISKYEIETYLKF
jgi:hypothetical protein